MTERMPDLPDEVATFFAPPVDNPMLPDLLDDDWLNAEPAPEEDMSPEFAALLADLAALDEARELVASDLPLWDYAPEDDPFIPETATLADVAADEREYVPGDTWERYLAAFPADRNPDVVEQELIDRAAALHVVHAQFVGLEQPEEVGNPAAYSVACLEVSADVASGGYIGRLLEIGRFEEMARAEQLYHELQRETHNDGLPVYAVHDYAEFAARERGMPLTWRDVEPETLAPFLEGLASEPASDEPPLDAHEQLMAVAMAAGEPERAVPVDPAGPAFHALSAIGITAEDFDPDRDPPPFYDPETGTAYWVGIFQPDLDDPEHCVASILALGRNPDTGSLEAQLAPCAPGDWDKAFESSQHLLGVMAREGIDACFLAAESMAIATEQRAFWEREQGMALGRDYAEQAAEYARETWDIEL